MSKKRIAWLKLGSLLLLALASPGVAAQTERLVVYTYDSFVSWGPAADIERGFEAAHPGVDVVFVAPGSSGEVLARVIAEIEAGGSEADVVVGISDTQLPRALERSVFMKLDRALIPNLDRVPEELDFDATGHVVPLDTGYVTIVYDSEAIGPDEVPQSLEDLTHPRFARKLIAIDPRTSSVGHAFLMWTIAEYGDPGFVEYWRRLGPSLLTVAGGWSEAYEQFTSGEAPLVVSYSTDTAYGVMYDGSDRFRATLLSGQAYRQVEAMGVVRGSKKAELAHAFIDYLLSEEVQSLIPITNWMFPANSQAKLPPEWEAYALVPEEAVWLDPERIAQNEARWLRAWAAEIVR